MEAWYKSAKCLSVRHVRNQCPSIPHLWLFGSLFGKPLPFSYGFILLLIHFWQRGVIFIFEEFEYVPLNIDCFYHVYANDHYFLYDY